VKKIVGEKIAPIPAFATRDNGRLRMGAMSPSFPPAPPEPENVADSGRMRMGAMSPTFPPVRAR
jgi:hypothetical protein